MAKKSKENEINQAASVAFVACIIIGVALGMLFDATAVGAMLGVGVGFLVIATGRYLAAKK